MVYENLDDLELVRHVARGDEKALKSFYDIYANLLFVYIKHLLNETPRAVVEDIWQETLLSAIKRISSFRGNSRLFTWICGIAKHKVFDYCKRKKISITAHSHEYINNLENLIDTNILPEDYVEQQATRRCVIETLGILPAKYQIILIQRYIDGSRVEDIAKSIGKTYKATESLLTRARLAFKSAFLKSVKE